jgi:kumamolisin
VYLRRPGPPPPAGTLSREDFAARYGADEADVEVVRSFASANGLHVAAVHLARRCVELSGTVGGLADAFGTTLTRHRGSDGTTYRGREGELFVERDVATVVAGVFGLDERPQVRPGFRPRATASVVYTPLQVAAAYDFPAGLTGAGECVALIELGGGYRTVDLNAYFASLGVATPTVDTVSVDGGSNAPSTSDSADGEVMLDVEVVGCVAPAALIAVYFAPNTDRGFLDAVTTAIHDTSHAPSVVSISWGSAESTWTSQAMDEMEAALTDAAAMGVSVTVAAGDNGSSDGVTDGLQHVDFPASAPHALACGGTRLTLTAGALSGEVVWNDEPGGGATGGGVSNHFSLPSYQLHADVPPSANPGGHVGRGVPDVAGDADPDTGYSIRVDGASMIIGGTSAVAPLWAGLIALLNQGLGRAVGDLHPVLYATAGTGGTRDVTVGSNGAYAAGPGWDACTGLGTPNGATLLRDLAASG